MKIMKKKFKPSEIVA